MRSHDRLAILGQRSALLPALLRAFASNAPHLRLIAPWGQPRPSSLPDDLELVTFTPGDFSSLRRALRACNALIFLSEPAGTIPQGVRQMRQLAQACRDSEVERMILVSCASQLGAHPGRWLREEDAPAPLISSDAMRWRRMIELERARFAADAMDIVALYPGLVWMPEHPALRDALEHAHDDSQIALITPDAFARATRAALTHAHAGARYGLAMGNVSVAALRARLEDHKALPLDEALIKSNRARFVEPLRLGVELDARRARRALALPASPTLAHLLELS